MSDRMDFLIRPLLKMQEYDEILGYLKYYTLPVCVTGPSDSQKAHFSYALMKHIGEKILFAASNEMQARRMFEDFSLFFDEDVLYFPSREIILHDIEARSYDAIYQRLRTLDKVVQGQYKILVTSSEALAQKLIPADLFKNSIINLHDGDRLDVQKLYEDLVCLGYERVDIVEEKGQFAARGGIIDIFPVNEDSAVRVELFDDEIDSVRYMDVTTQRSVGRLDSARVIPAREVIYAAKDREKIVGDIQSELVVSVKRKQHERQGGYDDHTVIFRDIERFKTKYYFPGIDKYIPYIIENPSTIADYAGAPLVILDEPARFRQRVENLQLEHFEMCRNLLEKGHILPKSQDMYFDYLSIRKKISGFKQVHACSVISDEDPTKCRTVNIPSRSLSSYMGHVELLHEDLRGWKKSGFSVVVLSGTRSRGERFVESLANNGIEAVYNDMPAVPVPGGIIVTKGSLNKGFEYPTVGLVVVGDREVFGQEKKVKKASTRAKGSRINFFTDLNIGDYVVHQSHGIGQYTGIEKLVVGNVKRDYIKIRYREGDHLYIPTNQLDLIQKYIGSEGKAPRLNRLGGGEWSKAKKKVKESLREIAEELIKLYAQRQALAGHAFSSDTVWQRQFEELFPYDETEDQLKCIEEIKRDMESPRVMDRLLCGDVGYGKTEVAIRAIFKAVMDGKQVAYLVPTTVLAQQHFMNFKERMKDFPVTVELLSRFRSPAEQRRVLKEVKAGRVDVLVGTHRLLQKDISFKNLGLLVVDEEQRFGVSHKEKLKNLKPNVDVLTLTATPIPRTLHMSLAGIRDISVIEDPPEERYPVQTYVMEFNRDLVRDAIIRELGRKGQVFYLYNRVRSIDIKASEIHEMVPEASIAVAHGQMDEKQLSEIMLDFINGKYDILVCTTIIESGLDMPNVNTIVVEDADRMGLSQLYQLRGRVGRSNRLAYAYITYKRDKAISEIAEKRLQAIKELTDLGSGFKIAMRDLEIRGAGNLLGAEQHGHMESVGYDMYCRLLDEAVRELRGQPSRDNEHEVSIDVAVSAYIDDEYIGVESQKIDMYKKIAAILDENDALDVIDELTDRYGDPPEPVNNLVAIAVIKALAGDLGFDSVTEKEGSIIFQLGSGKHISIETISRLVEKYRGQILFNAGASPYLLYKISDTARSKLLDNIKIMLQDIKSFEVKP